MVWKFSFWRSVLKTYRWQLFNAFITLEPFFSLFNHLEHSIWLLYLKIHGLSRVTKRNKRQLQTACGCWWWRLKALKEFTRNSFCYKNYLFVFQYVWFSTIYNYLHLLCKKDEIGTEFLSTFFTFDLNFRNFKDWITFRSDVLDGSLSRSVWFYC